MAAHPAIEAYIRDAAIKRGIDPETAVRVARAEALNVFDPTQPDRGGDEGSSFGPFQLHYAGMSRSMPNAGLGDEFTRATGLDARNPSTWRQQVDFSLDHAKRRGWGAWMGAAAAKIGDWQGIKDPGPYGGPGEGTGRPSGSPAPAIDTSAAQPATDYNAAFEELLASRPREIEEPQSLLADTLSSSVSSRANSGSGGLITSAADQPMAPPPLTDFAASAVPETTPQAAAPAAAAEAPTTPLAELFTVKEIGMPNEIDPTTGQVRPFRSRRAYG